MAIAIREYSNHSRYLMDEFHTRLQAEGKHNNYDRSSGLSYYTKRYVDMIEFIETHWSTKDKKAIKMGSWTTVDEHILSESFDDDPAFPDILEYKRKNKSVMGTHPESSTELRRKLLNLFLKNFEKSEDLEETVNEEDSNELFKARQERSSLLYVTIDYASHFVKIHLVKRMKSKTGNMIVIITPEDEEAEELLDRIIVLSDELMKMVHIERKAHCHHLRSDLFVDRSLFHRFRDEIDKSFEYLFLALREKEEEAAILGDLCLSKVLIIIADQFCQDKRYKESFPYFDRAIKIQKDHVGENQMSLGIYSYMAAQARAAAGTDHKKAISLLRNAIKIFEMYPNSEEYQRDIPRMTQLISYIQNKMNNES
jgi:tetratricopeptide (TPR) repeat protein